MSRAASAPHSSGPNSNYGGVNQDAAFPPLRVGDVACTTVKARAYEGSSRAEGERGDVTAAALETLAARVSGSFSVLGCMIVGLDVGLK
ncbi:hypothetical protein Godav_000096, partial [Gossypium davidsonii]|nr:hypothetical protein [Gossypium davidsonii]